MLKLTDVRVFPVDEDKLRAIATVTIANAFVVRDLKIISGSHGLSVTMPARKRCDGTYREIAYPLDAATREQIAGAVLSEYLRNARAKAG
jgi:stage V sporulation protein G